MKKSRWSKKRVRRTGSDGGRMIIASGGLAVVIRGLRARGDAEGLRQVGGLVESALKSASAYKTGRERVTEAHRTIDEWTADAAAKTKADGKEVSCRKGCASCCYLHVSASREEAELVVDTALKNNVIVDLDRLRAQEAAGRKGWTKLPLQQRRCVFLGEDNACQVYEGRPAACRSYVVVNPPSVCEDLIRANEDGSVMVMECRSNYGEAIATSLLTFAHKPGEDLSLPKLVSDVLNDRSKA